MNKLQTQKNRATCQDCGEDLNLDEGYICDKYLEKEDE